MSSSKHFSRKRGLPFSPNSVILSSEADRQKLASTPKGTDLNGLYVGSIPTRSTIKNSINLQTLFSYDEFEKAFNRLKKKNKFRQASTDFSVRNRYVSSKELNALGKFIQKHSGDRARTLYSSLSSYSLQPYRGLAILKKNGKYRPLLVPTPLDRLIFLAALPRIKAIIYSRLLKFSALGVGVKGKSLKASEISNQIFEKIMDKKTRYILALDFQDFFSTIRRDKLHKKLKAIFFKANERELLNLLVLSINNPIDSDDLFKVQFEHLNLDKSGIPQGLAYSPLLASFFATSLDDLVKKETNLVSYRYLDDMVIIGSNKRVLISMYRKIKKFSGKLGLKLHDLGGKTKILPMITSTDSFDFLGITFYKHRKQIPDSALEKFINVIKKEIIKPSEVKKSPQNVKKVFMDYVFGWKQNYFMLCPEHYHEVQPKLADEIKQFMIKKRESKRLYYSNENLFRYFI